MIRLVQFQISDESRRVGIVSGENILDVTDIRPELSSTYKIFMESCRTGISFLETLRDLGKRAPYYGPYSILLDATPDDRVRLLPPVDHPDPSHCIVSGTGLTHLGSTDQRKEMHTESGIQMTDSEQMFQWGIKGGRPVQGRGVQPEWFYKGDGSILKGHNDYLDLPSYAQDGGEEAEVAGCYMIDPGGHPHRVGFSIGNEWSDHKMEEQNFLWLAPSKLRTCAIGPELVIGLSFSNLQGRTRIFRAGSELYDSGIFLTGEENMSHSLKNLEDHHFKYPLFRRPGDVHVHFLGTPRFSFGNCPSLQDKDRIEIEIDHMGPPLVNTVRQGHQDDIPIKVIEP
jgi:hypothetical protein